MQVWFLCLISSTPFYALGLRSSQEWEIFPACMSPFVWFSSTSNVAVNYWNSSLQMYWIFIWIQLEPWYSFDLHVGQWHMHHSTNSIYVKVEYEDVSFGSANYFWSYAQLRRRRYVGGSCRTWSSRNRTWRWRWGPSAPCWRRSWTTGGRTGQGSSTFNPGSRRLNWYCSSRTREPSWWVGFLIDITFTVYSYLNN